MAEKLEVPEAESVGENIERGIDAALDRMKEKKLDHCHIENECTVYANGREYRVGITICILEKGKVAQH